MMAVSGKRLVARRRHAPPAQASPFRDFNSSPEVIRLVVLMYVAAEVAVFRRYRASVSLRT